MWYHLVGNFISFHMIPLLCRKNALFKHDSQITKYMFKMAAILEKAPSRNSSQDTACLPQIFLFPVKNWSRKTTWKFLLLQVAPPSVLTWSNCHPVCINDQNVSCLLYADDLVIVSESATGLQNAISKLENYCVKWNLEINLNKTQIMIFNKAGRTIHNREFYFSNKVIQVANE